MKKGKNYKLTTELKEIMKKSADEVRLNGRTMITPEVVVKHIITKYIDSSVSDVECEELFRITGKIMPESRIQVKADLKKVARKSLSSIDKDITTLFDHSVEVTCSPALDDVLSRISERRTLTGETVEACISTPEFLFSVLFLDSEACQILNAINVNKRNLLNILQPEGEGEEKEKEISGDTGFLDSIRETFKKAGIDIDKIMDSESGGGDDMSREFEAAGQRQDIRTKKTDPNSKTPTLDQFAIEMTRIAKGGGYDPVVGRQNEIRQITKILCCRKKNNAILLGDPGCGKTSIVELLAQEIASGNVPMDLKGKRLFSLDLNALVAGTQYRGQYEQRLQDIIQEVVENKNIIVFIDEIHNLIGNGSSSGSGDAANVLKPYLARGEFQCIGTTTSDEYRKFIAKDKALKRRFNSVTVNEPTEEETIQILKGIIPKYSQYHGVTYSEEAIKKCVEWSGRFLTDQFFPDKAITTLDMASSIAKLRVDTKKLDRIQEEIESLENQKKTFFTEGKFDEASEVDRKIVATKKKLETETKKMKSSKTAEQVTIEDVSQVISEVSGVPIQKIMSSDIFKIREMKKSMETKIIGQDEAVQQITLAFQRNMLGLNDPNKPVASFLLVGPTGVGKTLVSKLIASEFLGSEKNIIKISCSEYMSEYSESMLLGSSKGYVGSEDEPVLYKVKKNPYSVVLIDEIEKSNKNLYNIWLNILDEGEVTLRNGSDEKVSFRNCIVIFTGNVGTKSLELRGNGIGVSKLDKSEKHNADIATVMKEVKKEFRPEFINRLNKIIVFNGLGKNEMDKIFDIEFKKIQDRIKGARGYNLSVSESAKEHVISKCNFDYGARDLQRMINENIINQVCDEMNREDVEGKMNIFVDYSSDTEETKVIFS